MLPVSFGAMLMESMLAIIALIAVASFADGEAAAQGLTTQPQIFCRRDRKFSFRSWSAAFACIYINQLGGICICTDFPGFGCPGRASVVPGIFHGFGHRRGKYEPVCKGSNQ